MHCLGKGTAFHFGRNNRERQSVRFFKTVVDKPLGWTQFRRMAAFKAVAKPVLRSLTFG
jgi:hypothetical protein